MEHLVQSNDQDGLRALRVRATMRELKAKQGKDYRYREYQE